MSFLVLELQRDKRKIRLGSELTYSRHIKNPLTLTYYRKAVMEDCLPDQVRVDNGREFYLTLFVQESLAPLRTNTQRDPHRQTESK